MDTSGFIHSGDISVDNVFTEITLISSGAYSLIYKAKRYGQWYVLKCLKEEYESDTLYRELLKKEFNISIPLSHPYIVRTIGWDRVEGVGECIVMEYIEGCSFDCFLKEKHSSSEKIRVIKGVISALSYIHSRQIVHRDLKPSNIMVTTNGGNAKVLDFGLSDTDSYSILKHPAGTKNYISPKQLTAAIPDCRNDIYSLGKIMKEANINIFFNYLGNKCIRDRSNRFPNMESVMSLLHSWEKFIAFLPSLLTLIIAVVFISLYVTEKNDSKDNHNNNIMEVGMQEIDKLFIPIQELVGNTVNRDAEYYSRFSKMLEEVNFHFQQLVDSLTFGMDNVDKSTVSNGLYLYFGEKWNEVPEPVQDEP